MIDYRNSFIAGIPFSNVRPQAIYEWCNEHLKGWDTAANAHNHIFFFQNEDDRTLFLLRWSK